MIWAFLLACRSAEPSTPAADPTLAPIAPYDALALVDPFIGTGGDGFGIGSVNPGPRRPFGMVHAGPDTRGPGGDVEYAHCAGYWYSDDKITAFSHSHIHGMGVADGGVVGVMPTDGWDPTWTGDAARAVGFSHESEAASPGYYRVTLDSGVVAELTTTERAAVHRWTFPAAAHPTAVVDLGHSFGNSAVAASNLAWDGEALRGYQNLNGSYSGRFGGLKTWFTVVFEPAPIAVGTWSDPSAAEPGATRAAGEATGAWLTFPDGTAEVVARLAISYVDPAGADGNLAEVAARGFDEVRAEAEDAWRAELANVRVAGGTEDERVIFHTALFHAYQMPSLQSDVDLRYRGPDDAIHTGDGPQYSDFSLWDTFRMLHPWLILARPDRQRDFARSLLRMSDALGYFDRWPLAHGATGGMVGTPTDQVLAETWLKGIDGWDAQTAFDRSFAAATVPEGSPREGLAGYRARGWVAWEDAGSPAALTLEYAWSDAALAAWATALGRPDDAAALDVGIQGFTGTINPATRFPQGRHADGTFDAEPPDPTAWTSDFVEGGAWQYRWMMPWTDPVAAVHAGDDADFRAAYADFWEETYATADSAFPDPYYWHGNEPDLHDAWLGSLTGHPEDSAAPIRWIRDHRYRRAPDGLDGNDDGGTLSAWYLWASLGLYPIAGTDRYAVGSPWFDRGEVDLPDGTTLVFRAPGAADGGVIPDGPSLGAVFTHGELRDAGGLVVPLR